MKTTRKMIVAVTGASGALYARLLLEELLRSEEVKEIALILTENGAKVAAYEGVEFPANDLKIKLYPNGDFFAPVASGSADYDTMIVVPCSMGTAGRIASGVSADLVGRAADVMLKERRRLILVVRETPLSTIHLRNLTTLSECGAIVLPASPSFYARPAGIEALCRSVTERILSLSGIDSPRFAWGGQEG